MEFAEALRYLLSLGHETLAIKLGLRNITLLLEKLGNPHQDFFAVQIAGTNGKGSTAVMLNSICAAAGLKVGLFTSPHLVSITERVTIKGKPITPELFAECASEVRVASEELLTQGDIEAVPTFFEQVTAIALLAFKKSGVELAILETGLGGRLDATTAVGANVVGITTIAMDHEEYLGDTLSQVAAEKAAIIRPAVTAVVSSQSPEVTAVILERAKQCGVTPSIGDCEIEIDPVLPHGKLSVTFTTNLDKYEGVRPGLLGRHQVTNACLAVRLAEALREEGFEIPREAIMKGIEGATHAGRLQFIEGKPRILLDGAHNPSGARALRDYLDEFVAGPITLIFGSMRDKRLSEMASLLFPAATNLILTRPNNPRAATLDTLKDLARLHHSSENIWAVESLEEAVGLARGITPAGGLICITGSLYLVGEFSCSKPNAAGG